VWLSLAVGHLPSKCKALSSKPGSGNCGDEWRENQSESQAKRCTHNPSSGEVVARESRVQG
jgi:hypothetical protein